MPSLTSLEPAFLLCGVHPFLSMFTLRSLSLSRQGVALAYLDYLPSHDLVLWTDGSVPFSFGKSGSGVLANCSLCGTDPTLSFSVDPVCSSFTLEACTILQAYCWSWQHQQVCHFSSLLLSDSLSDLSTVFLFSLISLGDLAGTILSFFQYN